MTHRLKTLPEFYEALCCGVKRFEIRKNDRNFKVGDCLVLVKFENGKEDGNNVLLRNVDYITDFPKGLKKGYVCMGISPRGIMI